MTVRVGRWMWGPGTPGRNNLSIILKSAHFISKAFRFSPLGGKLVMKKAKSSYKVAFEGRF